MLDYPSSYNVRKIDLISGLLANIVGISSIDKDGDSTLQYLWDFEMIGLEPISRKQETKESAIHRKGGKTFDLC
jgi:hypothetical protein